MGDSDDGGEHKGEKNKGLVHGIHASWKDGESYHFSTGPIRKCLTVEKL